VQFVGAANLWCQNAGAVAAVGVAIWVIACYLQRRPPFRLLLADAPPSLVGSLSSVLALLATVAFAGFVTVAVIAVLGAYSPSRVRLWLPHAGRGGTLTYGDYIFSVSGVLALIVALAPMLVGITRLRWGRIWALARLSIKEAVRSRVVLVFAFMALVFLFADWFVPYRAEDQVRNYVRVVYWSITPLFLMTAALLGAFSIPNDIKSQAIHTIVTKPVEKFEIVLGRFLGYGALLSTGLAVVSGLSLLYVLRGVNENARQESFKARVPVFGQLRFFGTKDQLKGESVGREFEYRGYVGAPMPGSNAPPQYATFFFHDIPTDVAQREEPVTCEFTFDIFRLSKGEENKDIPCSFVFALGGMAPAEVKDRLAKIQNERARVAGQAAKPANFEDDLIERFGVYSMPGVEVTDYHTQQIKVPAAVFRKALAHAAQQEDPNLPALMVLVSVDPDPQRQGQLLGAARRDFYILAGERAFWVNFLKGIVGMWCTYMLVLGIAVACSTYLSGMISFLCTMFLFGAGLFTDYLQQLSENRVPGGGPAEAIYRVTTGRVISAPLDESPATAVMRGTDEVFGWVLRRILNLIPDVSRFDLHAYVANGFDVPFWSVLLIDNLIPLAAYLLPWAILAYYLMKYREIANPT
jgi:hypothetical protein